MLFRLLRKAEVRPHWIAIVAPLLIIGVLVWTAASATLLVWPVSGDKIWPDVWLFVVHRPSDAPVSMPFLRDYPSMVLACTVSAAIALVYSLYWDAERLHRDLELSGCVTYEEEHRAELTKRIDEVNAKLRKRGYFSPIALALALLFMVVVNMSMKTRLFSFLGPGLYENWWASLSPVRPGGFVWVIFGAIGIYMVYIEAVLGLTYVKFLRDLHRSDMYEFEANPLNPDGFFGWYRLRQIVTNLQTGVVCTMLSVWTFSYFLQPAAGTPATVIIMFIFIFVVLFVYFSVNSGFRRQVIESKRRQTLEVGERINRHLRAVNKTFDGASNTQQGGPTNSEHMLYLLVAYRHLEHISLIPSTPIRQRWLIAGLLSLAGTLTAIAIPLLQYFHLVPS
jgi:hypothetical protein